MFEYIRVDLSNICSLTSQTDCLNEVDEPTCQPMILYYEVYNFLTEVGALFLPERQSNEHEKRSLLISVLLDIIVDLNCFICFISPSCVI